MWQTFPRQPQARCACVFMCLCVCVRDASPPFPFVLSSSSFAPLSSPLRLLVPGWFTSGTRVHRDSPCVLLWRTMLCSRWWARLPLWRSVRLLVFFRRLSLFFPRSSLTEAVFFSLLPLSLRQPLPPGCSLRWWTFPPPTFSPLRSWVPTWVVMTLCWSSRTRHCHAPTLLIA